MTRTTMTKVPVCIACMCTVYMYIICTYRILYCICMYVCRYLQYMTCKYTFLCVICCTSNPEIGSKLKMPVGNKSRDLWKATTWEMAKEVSLYEFLTRTPLLNTMIGYIQDNANCIYSVLHCLCILHSHHMMCMRGLCMLHCVGT